MSTPLFRIETLTGHPVKVKDTQLRARSQVVQIRFPFISGGLIWNRPVAVLVHTAEGQDQTLPIPDGTRTATLALFVLSLVSTFLFISFRRKIA